MHPFFHHTAVAMVFAAGCGLVQAAPQHLTPPQSAQPNSTEHYRHMMFRESPYAPYRGIHGIGKTSPADTAHYRFMHDHQGRVIEISYQMNDKLISGNEVWDSFIWFAPKVKIAYTDDGETHTYFGAGNTQITAHGAVYRAEYQHDDQGRRTALRFYDEAGEPSENAWNVHRYEWRHAHGKVYEKRFDLNNTMQPMRPVLDFYEVELEYDGGGRLAFMRNLGTDGTPTNNESGAGIDRITYDHHGNFIRWQVYDKDGNAIEGNRPGVHLGEHLYDEFGNKVGFRGFDRHGNQMPFSWGAFEHVRTFNRFGNMEEHRMYLEDGTLDRFLKIEYNEDQNQIVWLKSLDANRQIVNSPMLGGAAQIQLVYNADGTMEQQAFNADMTPFTPPAPAESGE